MFIQEISIEIKNPHVDRAKLIDKMEEFVGAASKNGQTQGEVAPFYLHENRLILLACVLEKSSFSRKNDNIYVKRARSELEKMCQARFQVKTLGKDASQTKHICRCRKPASYILWTNFLTLLSPLDCGDCWGNVPLYRIPKLPEPGEQEYFSIGSWECAYQSCDHLQMLCGFGERWGTRQMQNHDSGLSKDGREVCRNIEKMVGVPVYYYLYNYRCITREQDKQRKCPECGGDWLLEEPWHSVFDFRCEPCRLVSSITCNFR
ncbi:MAG: Zn-ribbon-containing protein [Planctomycetaceae bacterium]|nr:Zn-ribbon-containing protein [Planctomycetaceae bacterium]